MGAPQEVTSLDLRDIKGRASAKRALEIAAAGGHWLLMNTPNKIGPMIFEILQV